MTYPVFDAVRPLRMTAPVAAAIAIHLGLSEMGAMVELIENRRDAALNAVQAAQAALTSREEELNSVIAELNALRSRHETMRADESVTWQVT